MAQDVNDIQAALEAAAMAEAASSTEAAKANDEAEVISTEETQESEEAEASKGGKAKDRIRELVGVRDGLQEQLDNIQGTVTERDTEIGKLVDLLQMREGDSQTLEQIRSLYGDERYKPMLETLDKALKGEHAEEAAASTEKDGEVDQTAAVKGLLQQARAELESEIADQHAELLLHKADLLTDKYIAELPDTYNESDKNVLKTVLVDHINWDAIEETPDKLPTAFAEGFQSALDWYGSPKGTVAEVSEEGKTTTEAPTLTEESIMAHIKGKDYAKMTTVKTPDGTELRVPELSEADFSKELADTMKAANFVSGRK